MLGNFLSPVEKVRNLGMWFNLDFSLKTYSEHLKSCFAQVQDLKHLKLLLWLQMLWLEVDLTTVIPCVAVFLLGKLQCVQNSLARIITNTVFTHHTCYKDSPLAAY